MLGFRKFSPRHSFKHKQRGMTVMELLVAGAISIIASSGMLVLMANTLGTGSHTIKLTRLTQDMRTTMQLMSRELRRANYHAGFLNCYGNADCLSDMPVLGDITGKIGSINITDNDDSDCFWFWYDRPQSGTAVAVTAETVTAFRRTVVGSVGKLQMTTTRVSAPVCNADTDWVDITDPNVIDVETFNVSNVNSLTETINAEGDTQRIERIGLAMTARLTNGSNGFEWFQDNTNSIREMQEFVTVRNNTTAVAAVVATPAPITPPITEPLPITDPIIIGSPIL